MLTLFIGLVLGAADPGCVDPARDLRALAREHLLATQDPGLGTERMRAAFATFLETGTRTAQLPVVTRYTVQGAGRHARRDLVLGIVWAASPDLVPDRTGGYRHRRLLLYSNAEKQAAHHLALAVDANPREWIAGVALARVALGVRSRDRLAEARALLLRLREQDAASVTLRIALADVLVAQDSGAAAAALLADVHGSCPAAGHAYAEALILSGDTARGVAVYLAALRGAQAQPDRFLEDAWLTMPFDDRDAFMADASQDVAGWLHAYWDRSAARGGRSIEERIIAQVTRAAYAQKHYRKANNPVLPGAAEPAEQHLARWAPPWDARGEVYLRHGPPDTTVSSVSGLLKYIPRNESWVYARDEPQWLIHFVWDETGSADWSLAGPYIGCGRSGMAPLEGGRQGFRAAPGGPDGALFARDYYLERAGLNELQTEFAKHCFMVAMGTGLPDIRERVVRANRAYNELIGGTLRTESARYPFRRALRLKVDAYAFRDGSGAGEVVAVAGLPKTDLSGAPRGSVALKGSIVGSTGRPLRVDSTFEVSQLGAAQAPVLAVAYTWRGTLPPDPRLHTMAADVLDAERGAYVEMDVPVTGGGERAISSIVIAAAGYGGPLVRGEHDVWPYPGHVVLMGETFRLFYEIYGLGEDEPIRTRISVTPDDAERARSLLDTFRGRRDARALEFDGAVRLDPRGIAVESVEIGGDLVPGVYTVRVEITASSGVLTRAGTLRVTEAPAGG